MRKLRDKEKGILFIALIFLVIAATCVFFAFSLKTNSVKEILERDKVIRILHVVENEEGNALFSNVLIYYPESKKAGIINLPGYTGAIYQSLGRVDKLEEVYNEKGINVYKDEVQKLLGISIQFTSTIKFEDFIKITDMLGGMRVFMPSPIDMISENGERWLLPSGAVNLDGDKIAVYLKYREEDESEDSIQERYQNVMGAFCSGIHDKQYNLFSSKKNYAKFSSCVNTGLDEEEEITLYKTLSDMDTESILHQTIAVSSGLLRNVDGKLLLFPTQDGENVRNAVKQLIGMLSTAGGSLSSHLYVIEIQNGTTVQKLAQNTSILFQNASYNVLSAINADRNDYEETVIIDHYGNPEVAKMIGDFIHCDNIMQADSENEDASVQDLNSSNKASVDFTVILGRDFNGQYVVAKKKKE